MKIDEVLAQEAKDRLEAAIQIAGALAGAEFFMKATGAYNLGNVTEFMVKAMIVAKKAGLELVVWDDDFDENCSVIEVSTFSDPNLSCVPLHVFAGINAKALDKRLDNIRETLLNVSEEPGQKA